MPQPKIEVLRQGEWSYSDRPVVSLSHTWVIELRSLLGRPEDPVREMTSRFFAAPKTPSTSPTGFHVYRDHHDDEVWFSLKVRTGQGDFPVCAKNSARLPNQVHVYLTYYNKNDKYDVGRSIFHKARLRGALEDPEAEAEEAREVPGMEENACNHPGFLCRHEKRRKIALSSAGEGMKEIYSSDAPGYGDRKLGILPIRDSDVRTLTVHVDVSYIGFAELVRPGVTGAPQFVPPCSLAQDMEAVLRDKSTTDVVLVDAGGKEHQAHKVILAARCPMFAAMFNADMIESSTRVVELADVSEEILKQVIKYIYTGRVDEKFLGVDLMAAGERFQLPRLKAMSERALVDTFSLDNALQVLVTADLYAAKELREAALLRVSGNLKEVRELPGWQKIEELPHLMAEILAMVAEPPESIEQMVTE